MNNTNNVQAILAAIQQQPSAMVRLAVTDIDGVLRGKVVSAEKFASIVANGFGFCNVVMGWDMVDVAYDNTTVSGWHTGYPDAQAHIDINTLRHIPWNDNMVTVLADFDRADNGMENICPRTLLKRLIAQANDAGFTPMFSQEFEWFNFTKNSAALIAKGLQPEPFTDGMFGYSVLRPSQHAAYFNQLFTQMEAFGVPLEGLHTETGPGVYEAAITYSHALEAADRAVLFKAGVKEIAYQHDIIPSFMAKWRADLPGCSGHVHQSLQNAAGENVFYSADEPNNLSPIMRSYIAGQLYCLPYILPMFAPTINSYKRLVEGAWAPTTLTWGIDNRTTAIRAIHASAKATRIETRVVGSDANPYLAMAACLAAGLYGIANNMELKQPAIVGNAYQHTTDGVLPSNLLQATQAMQESSISKALFGQAFVDHFCATRIWECRQYAAAVTDWELKRYFEII